MSGIKSKKFILLFFSALCLAAVLHLSLSHDGGQRRGGFSVPSAGIEFSRDQGFYPDNFTLEISGPDGCSLYYTTDCSSPTPESEPYTGPLEISDVSSCGNVHSMRTDISAGFYTELIEEKFDYDIGIDYAVPDYPVDKCTVIRAAAFDENGIKVAEKTASYFVGFDSKPGYDGLMILSVVTDPDNLFGYSNGIYVTGIDFDSYITSLKFQTSDVQHIARWDANYRRSGSSAERPASLSVFDCTGNVLTDTNCGLRIRGEASRVNSQKSFGFYAGKKYGTDVFSTAEYLDKEYCDVMVAYTGSSDNHRKIADKMASDFDRELDVMTHYYTPCAVFLDGEYWGVYQLTADYTAMTIAEEYGVSADNVIFVKEGRLKEGVKGDLSYYNNMRDFILLNDMTDPEYYKRLSKIIDIESYIDYYAAQIYRGRCGDWPYGNFALWRTRETEDGEYGDCKWRWMLYDVNGYGMDSKFIESDTVEYVMSEDKVFAKLMESPEFRSAFNDRLRYIKDTVYTPEKCSQYIEGFSEKMSEAMFYNNRRFYTKDVADSFFDESIASIEDFFIKRGEYVESMIEKYPA